MADNAVLEYKSNTIIAHLRLKYIGYSVRTPALLIHIISTSYRANDNRTVTAKHPLEQTIRWLDVALDGLLQRFRCDREIVVTFPCLTWQQNSGDTGRCLTGKIGYLCQRVFQAIMAGPQLSTSEGWREVRGDAWWWRWMVMMNDENEEWRTIKQKDEWWTMRKG